MGLIFGVKDMYDQVACGNPYEAEALRGMHIGRPTATVDDPSRQHMRAVREHRLLTKAVSVIWRVLNRRFTTLSTFTTDAALRAIENEVLVRSVRDMLSPADYENWAEFAVDNWHSVAWDNELGYYDDYDEIQEQTWAAEESIKITAAAAYAVNSQHTSSPRESAAITPRRQTGGSNDDADSASRDDHDSHVLALHQYNQHTASLICWTSALEVVSASIPAAKSPQKYPRYKGNYRLELSDYPDNFTPDYSFLTLARAAIEVGYTATHDVLDSALQATVGLPGHLLFQIYNRFERPLLPASADDGTGATVDEVADLSTLARQKDPGGVYMIGVRRVVKGVCHAWAEDPIHGEDIVQDVEVSTYISLLQHCDLIKWDASLGTYAKLWARSHLRDVLMRLKICIPRSVVAKRLALAKQLLASHLDDAPVDNAGCTSWEQHRRGLVANVEKYQKAISGLIVVGTSSLDAPLSDDEEDSLSVVDIMPGAPGDMVSDIERSEVTTVVRECLNNTVLDDLIEKIQTVSTKIREVDESDMEYLARVAAKNGSVVKLIKKTIGPDGLSALAEYL
ncbi:hypothetical protein A6M27_13005 [Acidithiobacillus thiooxidans]|uniref:Uncharacterized protein n=1 Tax=Acidithiobacillus thiooxidans TaxID=930 RepID=A0A1C2IU44_ACITH|nr:sigma-70 family RNA polymerase sigma factor [Acidithiobacillus thiooxidans]OCX68235.1 hypothetical protein A6P07_18600 [Acidithiobacillus thiooxidans]OCX68657.1 hypothetical protein A6O24_19520 [Acidithiobacillus thiooxidans]OCX79528.1 hypothetical protein A6O26_16395 [Acidithiobacillus thiooxidans]OCX86297.1 hypothetical protein A6M27_13005 [Acidithiobacillus thiooxidans]OFC51196.1 hypothetical protein BAE47_00140 [Acidithiobacillus thiooxidans]